MCGVVGNININSVHNSEQVLGNLKNAVDILSHRGPDDSGYETILEGFWRISLSQTRLSIIDLSEGGHQPYLSRDGNYSLVFNGEIYNYKELRNYLIGLGYSFYTESDTEVLLNSWIHWGVECIPKLKGMFSFVVYDKRKKLLTLVRDAFGIKPLFFHHENEEFSFASEINALRSVTSRGFRPNNQRLFDYLAFGSYDSGEDTFFEGVSSLEPGHILRVDLNGLTLEKKVSRWWWPDVSQDYSISRSQAVDEVRERFLENIRLHLISDVPLGAALSGGLDSSSIVCAMRYLEPKLDINTFSFIAPGSQKNEESWVDIVNQYVGAKAHKVLISPQDLADDLDDMIKYQGEPFGSTSIYAQYRVYKFARESGVTVTLDGQGADELFAGYLGYPEWRVRSLISSKNYLNATKFLLRWSKEPGRSFRLGMQNVVAINTPKYLIPLAYRLTNKKIPLNLFRSSKIRDENLQFNYPLYSLSGIGRDRALVARLRHALTRGELSQLLRHGDRNSMRWSIESRVPFLTYDFAEFVLKLPEEFLISKDGLTKSVFRDAMQGIVPSQILNRRDKIKFETPEFEWLKLLEGDIYKWLEGLELITWLDIDNTKKYLASVLSGELNFSGLTWRLINASRWSQLNSKVY